MGKLIIMLVVAVIGFPVLIGVLVSAQKRKYKERIRAFANESFELTPEEFFKMRNKSLGGKGRKHISTEEEFTGVYIIHNKTRDMYYVGQSKKVLQRVNQHFTGHGNGDVYADYKMGNEFVIKTISLSNSGYSSLDSLERDLIDAYDAKKSGYNRTKGNR